MALTPIPAGQMTPAQARVVDPILSTHARGYKHPERTGEALFPRATIPARGARVLRFGKESFRLYAARRAPGGPTKRVSFGYAADPVSVVQDSLEGVVPWETQQEAERVPGIDLARGAVDMVMQSLTLLAEVEQAQLATNPSLYDANHKVALTGNDKWSDPDSDPEAQMVTYREAVRRSIGQYPNVLHLSPGPFNALITHPKMKQRFQYTTAAVITEAMLAAAFQIGRVVVGKAVYADETAEGEPFKDVWGNSAILAYVPDGSNWMVPSYGYTYVLPGMPMVERPYEDRNAKSWIYPTTYERRPYLTGMDAGFLIQDPA